MVQLAVWTLAAVWASSGLVVIWLVGIDTLRLWQARRKLLRVAGGHVRGDGTCPHPGMSGPGHPPDDPTARPITAQVGDHIVTFTPVERRPIAPRARIRRRWDGRLLSRRESDAVLADVFGESR